MKKILFVGLLFVGQFGHAAFDPNADLWASENMNFNADDDLSEFFNFDQVVMGDADTLIEALGENPYYFREIGDTGIAKNWSDVMPISYDSIAFWKASKTQKEIHNERLLKMNEAVKTYLRNNQDSLDKANMELTKDAKALEDLILKSKNRTIKARLEDLMKTALMARAFMQQGLMKREKKVKIDEFKLTPGRSVQEALKEARMDLNQSKLSVTQKAAYQAVVNHLESVERQVNTLKATYNSLDEALQSAINASNRFVKGSAEQLLYEEVAQQLRMEQRLESELFEAEELSKQESQAIISKMLLEHDAPFQAFEAAEDRLLELEDELRMSQKRNDSSKNIEKYKHAIKVQNKVVKELKEKASEDEKHNLEISKRIRLLLKDNNDNMMYALDAAKDKVAANRGKIVKLDQDVVAELEGYIKIEENKQAKYDTEDSEVNSYVQKTYDYINNPFEAVAKAQEELQNLYTQLSDFQKAGAQRNHIQIKAKENEINRELKALDKLSAKAKDFDKEVNKSLKKLLDKHNQDKQKALDELLNSSYFGRLFTWNSAQSQADKIESMPEFTKENRVDKEVAVRLQDEIKASSSNDPYAAASAKLHSASNPVEVTAGLYGMIDATLAKVGAKVRVATLSEVKRRELAAMLAETQGKLLVVMQEPIPEMEKQDKKKAIIKEMLNNASKMLAQDFTGVSYEALKTGDAQTIGMDLALNKAINYFVPTTPEVNLNDFNYNVNAQEQSPYEILGVQPGSSAVEIKAAYKELAMLHHPDRGGKAEDFAKYSNAYQELMGAIPAA